MYVYLFLLDDRLLCGKSYLQMHVKLFVFIVHRYFKHVVYRLYANKPHEQVHVKKKKNEMPGLNDTNCFFFKEGLTYQIVTRLTFHILTSLS